MKEQGMEKTWAGYSFPGIDPDKIEEAMENRKNNFVQPKPKVTISTMDFSGRVKINFN